MCVAPAAPVCSRLAVSQSAEEATEAMEVSEEAGPSEEGRSSTSSGTFTEHVFTDNSHRYTHTTLQTYIHLTKRL